MNQQDSAILTSLGRYFPLKAQEEALLLGLTLVHVNRTLSALEKDGVLIKHRQHIEIMNEQWLVEIADFDGEYLTDKMDGLREYLNLAPAPTPA